jgi:hypothetical protein
MTKLLLVDLDKDYIQRVENGSDFKLKHDLFQEAVSNLQQDIKYWTASSGIELELEVVNETKVENLKTFLDFENLKTGQTLSRTHTRVYGVTDSNDDLAWINLSLGNIKPAVKLSRGEIRGWQFDWDKQ